MYEVFSETNGIERVVGIVSQKDKAEIMVASINAARDAANGRYALLVPSVTKKPKQKKGKNDRPAAKNKMKS